MNDLNRDELADLRARAYGPGAPGALDAVGWARLQELEAALRSPTPDASAAEGPESPVPEAELDPEIAELFATKDATSDAAPDPESDTQQTPARTPRRIWWLWAASLMVTAAVAAGAAFATTSARPVDLTTGISPQIVLQSNPSLSVPVSFWGSTGSTSVYEFYGLWVMRPEGGVRNTPQDCLLIADRDDIDLRTTAITGAIQGGCPAGEFPATVQFPVNEDAPAALRDAYPMGTGLRFAIDGDTVGVYISPAASPAA